MMLWCKDRGPQKNGIYSNNYLCYKCMKLVLKDKGLGLLSKFLQESDDMMCDLKKTFASIV